MANIVLDLWIKLHNRILEMKVLEKESYFKAKDIRVFWNSLYKSQLKELWAGQIVQ